MENIKKLCWEVLKKMEVEEEKCTIGKLFNICKRQYKFYKSKVEDLEYYDIVNMVEFNIYKLK